MDGGSGLYDSDRLTNYLQKIKQTVDYKHWLFGHMHINQTYHWERATCIHRRKRYECAPPAAASVPQHGRSKGILETLQESSLIYLPLPTDNSFNNKKI